MTSSHAVSTELTSILLDSLKKPSFWYTTGAITLILSIISVFKSLSLGHSGAHIAKTLGGTLANTLKDDFLVKRYINIVEEMSLASGVPIPTIYVQNSEPSINAFAAGKDLNHAAICVTRGALLKLNRDELQAVVGHEFSHILNGDMNLNIKLIGYIFGLSFIYESGIHLLRGSQHRSRHQRSQSHSTGNVAFLGVGLIALGALGMFFASLIKSILSRQREYLADAAAVQFTRNPEAVSSVLKKLWVHGSQIENPKASEASHMFFAEALTHSLHFPTHPPLIKRIQSIDPHYSVKKFNQERADIARSLELAESSNSRYKDTPAPKSTPNKEDNEFDFFTPAALAFGLNVNNLGHIDKTTTDKVHSELETLPNNLIDLVHEFRGAFTFLISCCAPPSISNGVIVKILTRYNLQEIYLENLSLQAQLCKLHREQLFSMIKMSVSTLKSGKSYQLAKIPKALFAIANLDKMISRREMIILLYVTTLLKRQQGHQRQKVQGYLRSVSYILSYFCRISSNPPEPLLAEISNKLFVGQLIYEKDLDFNKLSQSLIELSTAPSSHKQKIVESGLILIQQDGTVSNEEYAFFRLIAESLEIPLPKV